MSPEAWNKFPRRALPASQEGVAADEREKLAKLLRQIRWETEQPSILELAFQAIAILEAAHPAPIPDAERREKHWREAAVAAIRRFNQERAEDDGWVQTQADQVVNGLRAHLAASKPAPEAGEAVEHTLTDGWSGTCTDDCACKVSASHVRSIDEATPQEWDAQRTCTPAPPAVCEACTCGGYDVGIGKAVHEEGCPAAKEPNR